MGSGTLDRAAAVHAAIDGVADPEIPVLTVYDLGIVREVSADGRKVTVTPTYSGCPATAAIEADIRRALNAAGLAETQIVVRLDPAWTTDWITAEGREKLHAYGIAPPSPRLAAACPRCGSPDTEAVSEFGSTPCKALWRCRACAEPFDRFKCH
ncbi:MAG TPA: 1,2-phenylacetyl-CoA epoxidase subunit PaaD [Caulobacteraceae bacterium]|nr:1,2-phenylacetyl-CoA epoxidase subunit PaaD [Caulobacteraceae bacterium]